MASDAEIDLRRALESNEIIPYFQPLVELRTGLLTGFEVLARWMHPQRGMVAPDEFIPLAERTGLNGLLTGTLLRAVFAAAKAIPDHLTLSVNISLTQLNDLSLPRHVRSAAEQASFPLHRLILEITESALASSTEHAYLIAHQLKEQGSRLALDDFGTGYSSLRHLQALPFDELKVDASFVRSMTHARESRKIAAAIIGLGNSLGLVTVAEGVENQTHADMLLWLGCDLGQGWLYGRPVPAEELAHFIHQRDFTASHEHHATSNDPDSPLYLEALPAQRLAQLHAIYDGAPVGLCFLDRTLRCISINKRLAQMNNIPVTNHLGRGFAELLPSIYPFFEPYLHRSLNGEAVTDIEFRQPLRNQPDEYNTFLVTCQPARDEANEVIGISISVVDITKRKKAEEALAESEDHYRHAVELNPQIPWTADPNGMVLDASNRWEALTGQTVQDALGEGWIESLHPDDVQPTLANWHESLRTGHYSDIEYRVRRRDGRWRWMRARAAPRYTDDGKIMRWYGTLEDIEDRKSADEALRHSEARLQAVFDAVPVGIVIAEAPGGQILMSNPRADAILGQPFTPGLNIETYAQGKAFHPDGRRIEDHGHPLARAIQRGETTDSEEIDYQHPDGSFTRLSVTAAPISGVDGEVIGGVVAFQDINEAKHAKPKIYTPPQLKKLLKTLN